MANCDCGNRADVEIRFFTLTQDGDAQRMLRMVKLCNDCAEEHYNTWPPDFPGYAARPGAVEDKPIPSVTGAVNPPRKAAWYQRVTAERRPSESTEPCPECGHKWLGHSGSTCAQGTKLGYPLPQVGGTVAGGWTPPPPAGATPLSKILPPGKLAESAWAATEAKTEAIATALEKIVQEPVRDPNGKVLPLHQQNCEHNFPPKAGAPKCSKCGWEA